MRLAAREGRNFQQFPNCGENCENATISAATKQWPMSALASADQDFSLQERNGIEACRLLRSGNPLVQETRSYDNKIGKYGLMNAVRLCVRPADVIMLTFRRPKPLLSPH